MRRRRQAPLAAAVCLTLVVLLVASHGAGAAMPAIRHQEASGGAGVRAVATAAFDAAAGVARCKKQGKEAGAAAPAACAGLPGPGDGDDDDDKRVVPTGANPLHNR